jgi:hypothetical protein
MEDKGYILGLDLGQANDYTAAALVRRLRERGAPDRQYTEWNMVGAGGSRFGTIRTPNTQRSTTWHHHVVHLQRWPTGTAYPAIVRDVAAMMDRPEIRGRTDLVIDRTGVGRAVFDMFEEARLQPHGITITGGETPGYGTVPKKDLVGVLQAGLQGGRIKIAPELPEAALLVGELQNFEVRVSLSTGHASYAADWRSGTHDDLVLALACAVWYGENKREIDPSAYEPLKM